MKFTTTVMGLALAVLCLCGAVSAASWTDDEKKREAAAAASALGSRLPQHTVNLDDPLEDRWAHIAPLYADKLPGVLAYLETMVPKWAIPVIEKVAGGIEPYFRDYGDEMIGIAKVWKVPLGEVVTMNLIYQLEHIGINCSNWNNTGPTFPNDPGCEKVDPNQKICYCHKHRHALDQNSLLFLSEIKALSEGADGAPGLCTSVVAQDPWGHIWHGRNLDWNLPVVLREMAIDVTFTRGGKPVFKGTTLIGFVGLFNGLRYDDDGKGKWSASIDARGKGGTLAGNFFEALVHKAITPEEHLRKTFETQSDFKSAVDYLAESPLVDEIYYVVAGVKVGEGVVVSRDRNNVNGIKKKAADRWYLNASSTGTGADGWFRLQTNYDHWNPVPKADDRRTPGIASMTELGQTDLGHASLMKVMKTWPVFNHHTDYTVIIAPFNSTYDSNIWLDQP